MHSPPIPATSMAFPLPSPFSPLWLSSLASPLVILSEAKNLSCFTGSGRRARRAIQNSPQPDEAAAAGPHTRPAAFGRLSSTKTFAS